MGAGAKRYIRQLRIDIRTDLGSAQSFKISLALIHLPIAWQGLASGVSVALDFATRQSIFLQWGGGGGQVGL